MKIHKEGFKIVPLVLLGFVGLNGLIYFMGGLSWFFYLFLILSAGFALLATSFFRDPETIKNAEPGQVLAPADGVVVVIEPTIEKEYFKDERIQVSTFMSVYNVHINHVPVEGEIVYQKHHKGKFLVARIAKSSDENERCTTVIRTADGTEILLRQVAGMLARRIVTYKKPGQKVSVKDQLGFIRFGSRVDVFLPVGSNIKVSMGEKLKGGVTVLASL